MLVILIEDMISQMYIHTHTHTHTHIYIYQSNPIVNFKYVPLVCFNYISTSHVNKKKMQLCKYEPNKYEPKKKR